MRTSEKIATVEHLRTVYNAPGDTARRKQLTALDTHARHFLTLSPFVILSTSGPQGIDASPRGGPPGFVQALDDHTLLVPDWPGNNRLDSFTNLLANPQVGLLFLIPGVNETLRVNGEAGLYLDKDLLERFETRGRLPLCVVCVEVEEVFLHCAKALMRSRLWSHDAQVERSGLPSLGEMLKDQLELVGEPESQEVMERRYQDKLY